MGFKYKKFSFIGGSETFPTGNTYELRLQRSKAILTSAAEALINTDTGWTLDTSRNATTTSYANVPCMSGSNTFPGLFFVNTISGCKLFMTYFCGSFDTSSIISNFGNDYNLYYISSTTATSGLVISIIPANSTSQFGSSFDSSFLPQDATRLVGTCFNNSRTSSYSPAHGSSPSQGSKYTWGILATPYVVGVGASMADSISSPVYVTGKIFGNLAHAEDNAVNAEYGTVFFRFANGGDSEGWSGDIASSISYFGGTDIKAPGVPETESSFGKNYVCGIFSKPDGTWVNGTNQSNYSVRLLTSNPFLLSNRVFSTNNNTWWQPLLMLVMTTDLTTYNVVSGDGFKGYLDTDLFRCGLGTWGTLFDNGNFIKANEDIYNNLILGWSPTGNDTL